MTEDKSAVDAFLDKLEGSRVPFVDIVEEAQKPYCDSCSKPINPNRLVQTYISDKLITGEEVPAGYRALRLHCQDCRLPRLFFGCQGFNEFLVNHTLDTDWRIVDPEMAAWSGADDGLPYDPVEIMEGIFGMPYQQLMAAVPEAQGPQDVIDIVVQIGLDPRDVISEDGTITLPDDTQERLMETGERLMDKQARGKTPPQMGYADRLRGFLGVADWQDRDDE